MSAERLETVAFSRAARARGEADLATTVVDAAIAQVAAEDAGALAALLLERAELAVAAGDLEIADDAARRAGPLADRAGQRGQMAEAAWMLGQIALRKHDLARATYWWGQSVEIALLAEAWPIALRAQRGLAAVHRLNGDLAGAEARLRALCADAETLEMPTELLACRLDLAHLALDQGDAAETIAQLELVLEKPELLPALLRGEAGILRARLLLAIDDQTTALTAIDEALHWLRMSGDQRGLGAGLLLAGQIRLLAGQHEAAGRDLGEALLVTERANLPERAVVERVIARIVGGGQSEDAG